MRLVKDKEEILGNIGKLRGCFSGNMTDEFKKLISRGRCFVVINKGSEYEFYPSKFIGYSNNSIDEYFRTNTKRDGRVTNKIISKILGDINFEKSSEFDIEYLRCCEKYNIKFYKYNRKYYLLKEDGYIRINNKREFLNNENVLKKEFIEYMKKRYKDYKDSTIKTFFSDAKYLINNEIGYDFYSVLLDENFINKKYGEVLTKHFSNCEYKETPKSHSTGYVRAIKYLREFMIYKKYILSESEEIKYIEEITSNLDNTEKERLVKTRIGQGVFRAKLINREGKCEICGLKIEELLIASHCKPWCKSNDNERIDEDNGLLLCPNHDALFDKGFITFDDDGKIRISSLIPREDYDILNIKNDKKIILSSNRIKYMSWHRKNIFK